MQVSIVRSSATVFGKIPFNICFANFFRKRNFLKVPKFWIVMKCSFSNKNSLLLQIQNKNLLIFFYILWFWQTLKMVVKFLSVFSENAANSIFSRTIIFNYEDFKAFTQENKLIHLIVAGLKKIILYILLNHWRIKPLNSGETPIGFVNFLKHPR